ncbi:potassium channel subfamily K member 13-like [Scleropages formosus]|uniref:Potassium channel subfamily K member 13-like n=1 Tax=Scleropages formosus TaxID=113540 RepID=A0A0P7XJP1_SCLFO|nr:potassium channel subfamily K member 13 [Scleropages formosus]KPP75268.1 potassium channel subfamily K member 13-like [Scleropages formosus]
MIMGCRCAGGCCGAGLLNEDNARFLLLALLIVLYLLCGAAVFSALEQPRERQAKEKWALRFERFSAEHNLSRAELEALLRSYEEANLAGVRVDARLPRWDFAGALYFVGTVVSTIGFGMTTPATVGGKIFLIFYGLIGCASTILFFNLFLERLITLLAVVLRSCHELQRRRKGVLPHDGQSSSRAGASGPDSLAEWKPSVYYVMLILCLGAVLVSCCASAMFSAVEGWSYMDSLYFCFVAFSTIGFGDLVSSQQLNYEYQAAYHLGNFLFIFLGVCCIYSLFNVISIVIKQILNWILRWLERPCGGSRCCPGNILRPRRNLVMPSQQRARRNISIETDGGNESEVDGRRMSEELISMRDFLAANKVSLAIMQKQLSETATGHLGHSVAGTHHNGFSGGVGALAIMNNRLVETSVDR